MGSQGKQVGSEIAERESSRGITERIKALGGNNKEKARGRT